MRATVEQGRHYRATIRLGFFEQVATDQQIADKLTEAGFTGVQVFGTGRDRFADGTWPGSTMSAELPDQIIKVEVLP